MGKEWLKAASDNLLKVVRHPVKATMRLMQNFSCDILNLKILREDRKESDKLDAETPIEEMSEITILRCLSGLSRPDFATVLGTSLERIIELEEISYVVTEEEIDALSKVSGLTKELIEFICYNGGDSGEDSDKDSDEDSDEAYAATERIHRIILNQLRKDLTDFMNQ